jgi:F-type H+-transporting ATPase subunit b
MVELNNMIIAQMIAFIILLFLLNIILYKPILSMIGKRKENVEFQLSQAEKVAENAEEKRIEHEKILENARANGKKLYNDLVSEAISEKDKLLHETEEKLRTEIHKFNDYIEEIKKKELKQGEHLSDSIANKIFNKLTV